MQIAGAIAILMMAVVGDVAIHCIYFQDREDDDKSTFIVISVISLNVALALSVTAWVFMSEVI